VKYVYLIQSLENGYYKVGVSKHPQKRIEQLQTGNSSELKLIEIYQSEVANKIEKILQNRLTPFRKVGEWFDMPMVSIANFGRECKSIEEMIAFLKKMIMYLYKVLSL
jgi:hypothetical protein